MTGPLPSSTPLWYLEGFAPETHQFWRTPLNDFPFRIGRRAGAALQLASPQISQDHAIIERAGDALRLRDLGSTNGTFVNGERVLTERGLAEGDIVQFASVGFRVGRLRGTTESLAFGPLTFAAEMPSQSLIERALRLRDLLESGAVEIVFQPIVALPGGEVVGCEALGRGRLEGLPEGPAQLFEFAAEAGFDGALAEALRLRTFELGRELPAGTLLFVNLHPVDLEASSLLPSLQAMRTSAPAVELVLEVSERQTASLERLRAFQTQLAGLGVLLAYDDFGSGQARLNELAEVPPAFLKFDASLVAGLDRAPEAKRALVRALVRTATSLGMATVAEGIESAAEAAAAIEAGFTHAQGFHFGRPAPLSELRHT